MRKSYIPLIALLISGSALAGDIKEIRFGVDPTFAPFESKDPNGNIVGFDIDLGNAICQKLQTKCTWVENNFDAIIPALHARKFDAILSGMTMTPKRKEQIDFTDKIYNGPIFMVARKNTTITPELQQLQGKAVGVQHGSSQESYANKTWRGAGVNIVSYQDAAQVIEDLVAGRIDAAVLPGVVAEYNFLNKPQGKDFTFVGNALKDPALFGAGVAIGLRKDDAELREAINGAISQMLADGTYQKLAKKYFSFDIYAGA